MLLLSGRCMSVRCVSCQMAACCLVVQDFLPALLPLHTLWHWCMSIYAVPATQQVPWECQMYTCNQQPRVGIWMHYVHADL